MSPNPIFKTPQGAWASRPHRAIPVGGTPTLLELLSSCFFAATCHKRAGASVPGSARCGVGGFAFSLLAVSVFLWITIIAPASAQTPFSGNYTFPSDGAVGNVSSFNYNGAVIPNLTVSAITKNGVTTDSSVSNFRAKDWQTGATNSSNTFNGSIDLNKYFAFTLTPDAGYALSMSSITFGIGRSSTGTRQAEWRSSIDSYSSTISSYSATNASVTNNIGVLTYPDHSSNWAGNVLNLSGATYQSLSSPVTFRIYLYNAEGNAGTAGLAGPLTFNGSMVLSGGGGGSTTWSGAVGTWSNGTEGQFGGNYTNNLSNVVTFEGAGATVTASGTPQAGNLFFNSTGYTLAGAVQLGVGSITTNGAISTMISANISGNDSSGLSKDGVGTLILSGSNSYTGTTNLNNGVLTIGNANALGSSGDITFSGGTLQYGTGITTDFSSRIKGSGSAIIVDTNNNNVTFATALAATNTGGLTKQGTGTLTLSANNTLAGPLQVTGGALSLGAGTTLTVNTAAASTISGTLSGSGNLTKTGAGNLTLSGSNSYSGETRLEGGVLEIGHNNALGNGSFLMRVNGVTIRSTDATDRTIANAFGQFAGTSATYNFGSAETGNLTFTSTTTAALGASRTFNIANSFTRFDGGFSGSSQGITKIGDGTMTLNGSSSYTGATTINAGTLQIGNGGTTGALSTSSAITVNGTLVFNRSDTIRAGGNFSSTISGTGVIVQNGSGILELSGAGITHSGGTILNSGTIQITSSNSFGSGVLTLNSGTLSSSSGSARSFTNAITIGGNVQIGSATQTGAITASGNITLGDSVRTLTIEGNGANLSGVISGTGGLTKAGAGSLTLNGSNTYTGSTTVNAGTLRLGGTSDTNSLSGEVTINSGGTLNYDGSRNNKISDAANISISGGTFDAGANTETIGSLALSSGNFTKATGTFTLGSGLSMSGGNLSITASGTLALGSASTISGGAVTLTSTNARIETNGTTTLGSSAFSFNNASSSAQGLALGGNISVDSAATANFTNVTTGLGRIDLNGATRVFDIGAGAVMNVGWVIAGSAGNGLTKNGTGTLTLSATNTYAGATTINAGTIVLNGSSTSSAIAINSGGTLAGTGSGGATTVNSGGLISPGGSSIGTLAASTLTLNGGGGYTFSIGNVAGTAGTNWDLINVGSGSGAVTINSSSGSPFTIYVNGNPTGWSGAGTYAWDIISSNKLATGGFSADKFAVDLGGFTPADRPGSFFFTNSGTALVLNYAVLGDSTWTGGSGNWDTGFSPAPTNLANVFFTGAAGGTATNNIASTTLDELDTITFNATAGSYTLAANAGSAGVSGTPLKISGSVANESANAQNINLALSFEATRVVDTASGNITIGGVINGAGGLTKNGSHTLTLSGTNTFTGAVQINSGTLATTVANALSNAVDVTLASGAAYSHSGGNDEIRSLNATGSVLINSGTLTIGGTGVSTVSGQISGDALLIKAGTGSLTLSNSANSYSGGTRLTDGILLVGHNNALGSGALNFNSSTNGTIRSTDGTTRTISNALANISGSSWNVNFGSADSGDLVFSSTTSASLASGATRTFTVNNAATTFAMAFTNSSIFLKAGTGTMILTGNSTYSGATIINAGTLQLGSGGTIGALSTSSAITVNANLAFNRSDTVTQGANFSNSLGGSGVVVQNGSGTLILNQANTHSGGTTLNSGTLRLDHSGAAGTGTLTQSSGASLLHLNATGTFANAMDVYNVRASETLTLSGGITVRNATFDVDNGDILTISGGISGSGGAIKNGTGTLDLSGSNSFTGATTVNSGTLEAAAANALGSTSSVVVNTGGSLLVTAGNSINNAAGLTLAGGTLTMNGTFNESLGALTLAANSIIDLEGFDGTLTFSGLGDWSANTTLSITNWSGVNKYGTPVGSGVANRHVVFANTTGLNSYLDRISFYSGDFGQGFAGTAFQIGLNPGPAEIAPVPEPETWVTAVILIVGGLVWMIRRQRARKSSKAARQDALKFSESTP